MDFEVLLGSVVVAAIISGIVAIYKSDKANKLEYITKERSEWREEIRKCSEKLGRASYQTTRKICDKLKVRINAFGKSVSNKYSRDAHIWKLIAEIESENFIMDDLSKFQTALQQYLTLLLKWDWEKSKKEVSGDKKRFLEYVLWILSALLYAWGLFYELQGTLPKKTDLGELLIYLSKYMIVVVLAIIVIVILETAMQDISSSFLEGYMVPKAKKVSKRTYYCIAIFNICCGVIASILYMVILYYILGYLNYNGNEFVGVITLASVLIGIGAVFSYQSWLIGLEYSYFEYVKAVDLVQEALYDQECNKRLEKKRRIKSTKWRGSSKGNSFGFDFELEAKIYKHLCYKKDERLDDKYKFKSYKQWKDYITNKYSVFSIEQLQEFDRWLNQKIRLRKPDHEYRNTCITVLITWFFTKLLDEFSDKVEVTNNIEGVMGIFMMGVLCLIIFCVVLFVTNYLCGYLFENNETIALYTDYKEIIDEIIAQRENSATAVME